MDSLYNWIVWIHNLDLSNVTTQGMYVGIFILLGAGIAAAFMAGLWGRASSYFRDVRRAAGQPYETGKGARTAEPPNPNRLRALLASSRPIEIAGVGYAGLIAILWLMVMKPF